MTEQKSTGYAYLKSGNNHETRRPYAADTTEKKWDYNARALNWLNYTHLSLTYAH